MNRILIALLFIFGATVNQIIAATYADTIRVAAATDDVGRELRDDGQGDYFPDLDVELATFNFGGHDWSVENGFRFSGLHCKAGDIIDSVKFGFIERYGGTSGATINIKFEKTANPGTFTDSANFVNRTMTTASWNWTSVTTTAGVEYIIGPNASLTASLQEVLDGTAKADGNAVAVKMICTDAKTLHKGDFAYNYNEDPTKAMRIMVYGHTTAGGATPTPAKRRAVILSESNQPTGTWIWAQAESIDRSND